MGAASARSIWNGHTLAVLVFQCLIGSGTVGWSRELFQLAGHDVWLSMLLAAVPILLVSSLITWAVMLHPHEEPGGLLVGALGAWPGRVAGLGFVAFLTCQAGVALRLTVELLHSAILPRTPSWLLITLLSIPTLVLVQNGVESVVRFQASLFWPTVLLATATVALGLRYSDWGNFLPVLSGGFVPALQGVTALIPSTLGLPVLLIFLAPYTRSNRGGLRAVVTGTAAALAFLFALEVAVLVSLGPHEVESLTWPLLEFVQGIYLPGLFFERIDLIYLIALLVATSWAINLNAFAAHAVLSASFCIRKSRWPAWGILAVVWVVAAAGNNLIQVQQVSRAVLEPVGLFYAVGLPALLVIAGLRKRVHPNSDVAS